MISTRRKYAENITVIGLTGGIGSGKSTVARLMYRYSIPIIDADDIAHTVTDTDDVVREAIREQFGASMYDENGSLRRAQLGELIFSDKNARAKLNNILHPRILEILRQRISQLAECGASLVIVDAALIYESGIEAHFDKVVVVYAPLEQRLARLRQRDGLKTDSILERINAQLPLEKKVNRADFVVYNSFSLFALRRQARTLHAWLLALNRGKL